VTPRRALTALAALAVLGGLFAYVVFPGPAEPPAPGDVRAPTWPEGATWHWRLEWAASSALSLDRGNGPVPFEGTSRVEGVLRARGLGWVDGHLGVAFSLLEASRLEVSLNGAPARDAQGLSNALVGHEAVALFDDAGALVAIRFLPDAEPLFQTFLQSLLGDAQQVVRAGAAWTATETTVRGRASAAYAVEGPRLTRRRTDYAGLVGLGPEASLETLTSTGEATFDAHGGWATVSLTERLIAKTPDGRPQVAAVHLSITPTSARPVGAESTQALLSRLAPAQAAGEVTPARTAAQQMLAQRIDGLTAAQLMEGLGRFGTLPASADKHRFALRATGLLLQQPRLCDEVASELMGEGLDRDTRAFGLQLLAATGTAEAQAAMRALLASPAVTTSEHRGWLTVQLGLVERPTPETVAFTESAFRELTGTVKYDAALALGATAGALERQTGALQPGLDELARALDATRVEAEQVALLRSLGNAGAERLVPTVLARAESPSPAVRRAAADALRKTPTRAARRALERLAEDSHVEVQRQALATLEAFPFEQDTVAQLHDSVRRGKLGPAASGALVTFLAPHADSDAPTRALLAELLKRPVPDPSIHTRIRSLLGETP
jgi:HEAT repeat protein